MIEISDDDGNSIVVRDIYESRKYRRTTYRYCHTGNEIFHRSEDGLIIIHFFTQIRSVDEPETTLAEIRSKFTALYDEDELDEPEHLRVISTKNYSMTFMPIP